MVYILLVDGFEEIEALTPVDVLRRCGIGVKTVGVKSKKVLGAHNIPVEADITIDEINDSDMEMIVLPGGPGHTNLKCDEVYDIIETAHEDRCYIAAICAAPSVIGEMGLLKNKKATCFPGFEESLEGATVVSDKVVCDGLYITGKGPGAAAEFSFKLAELLCGGEKTNSVRSSMQY